jgi:hypothetical protein
MRQSPFCWWFFSQAATSTLYEAEVLHPVVLVEQISEHDGRLNPPVVLNLCLYCCWSANSYMFRLSFCYLQGVFLYSVVNVIPCRCTWGLRSFSMHERIVMSHLSCSGCKKGFLAGRRPYNLRLWDCPVKTLTSLRRLLIVQPIATYMANYKNAMCTVWCHSPHAVQVMTFISLLQTWSTNLTFRGPYIVVYFYNKNQQYTLISQIYFWNRTLHVSDGFSVHHQEASTAHTAIGICHTGYADCLLAGSGWNCVPSWSR